MDLREVLSKPRSVVKLGERESLTTSKRRGIECCPALLRSSVLSH